MSIDILKPYLKPIADAIRSKKGTTEPINAQNFATEILNLPSGGSSEEGLVLISNPNTISDNAYQGSDLISVIIPNTVTSIGTYAFDSCTDLKKAIIFASTISAYMFRACSNLTDLVIGDTVKSINEFAFSNCTSLKTVTVPSSVTRFGIRVFTLCSALETAIINSSNTTYDGWMFYDCDSLKKVIYNGNCSQINGNNYFSCGKLEVLDFRNNTAVATLSTTNAFTGVPTTCKVVVPDNLHVQWIRATNWISLGINGKIQIVKASDYTEE